MKQSVFRSLVWVFGTVVLLAGCASTSVERVGVDETVDLSGRWNDSDSRMVSEEMIGDVLSRPWIDKFRGNHRGQAPTVIVGTIRNRSDEHINTRTFVKDLERALINSGEIEFVAAKGEREEMCNNHRLCPNHADGKQPCPGR